MRQLAIYAFILSYLGASATVGSVFTVILIRRIEAYHRSYLVDYRMVVLQLYSLIFYSNNHYDVFIKKDEISWHNIVLSTFCAS